MLCSYDTITLGEISNVLGWQKGATSAALGILTKRGFVEKKHYGHYKATELGQKEIREIIEEEYPNTPDTDDIVYKAANFFTDDSFLHINGTSSPRVGIRPGKNTKILGNVLSKVYIQSVAPAHRDNPDMVKSMWRNHQEPVCISCNFDFYEAYRNNSKQIHQVVHDLNLEETFKAKKLFSVLRYVSSNDTDWLRHSLRMKSKITKSIFPEDLFMENEKDAKSYMF